MDVRAQAKAQATKATEKWQSLSNVKKMAIVGATVVVLIAVIVTIVETAKPKHKKTGATMQERIVNAYNVITRSDGDDAPTPMGADLPHRYIRQGMESPNTYHYRMGDGFRPHVQADGVRGPQGKMMDWPKHQGSNSEYDISQKRHGLGANSEIDINKHRNGLGANSEIDINKHRNGLGANSEIDINKHRNGLGASSEYNLSRLPMGSADAGPSGLRLSDAYSSDYKAGPDPEDGSNTYVDYSPDNTSVGGPAFASDMEASAQLLSDVYGDAYKFSDDAVDGEMTFIGGATPSSV